jgi:hypothetical protein
MVLEAFSWDICFRIQKLENLKANAVFSGHIGKLDSVQARGVYSEDGRLGRLRALDVVDHVPNQLEAEDIFVERYRFGSRRQTGFRTIGVQVTLSRAYIGAPLQVNSIMITTVQDGKCGEAAYTKD